MATCGEGFTSIDELAKCTVCADDGDECCSKVAPTANEMFGTQGNTGQRSSDQNVLFAVIGVGAIVLLCGAANLVQVRADRC